MVSHDCGGSDEDTTQKKEPNYSGVGERKCSQVTEVATRSYVKTTTFPRVNNLEDTTQKPTKNKNLGSNRAQKGFLDMKNLGAVNGDDE